jgi:hypothetical protein
MHVISSLKNTANRFRKSVRASLQGCASKGIERSPEGPAAPQMRCRFAILFPGAGLRGRYIFLAVITKRAAAIPTIAVPRMINASPAMLPNFWPGNDRVRPAKAGAPNSRNRSNFSTRNPKAITAMDVRTQARNVRSFAEWSLKFLIILSVNMTPNSSRIWRPASFCSSIAPLDQKMCRAARWGWRSAYIQRDLAVPRLPLDPLQILEHARAQLVPKRGVLFGMTGAGKPAIVADLLAQIGTISFRFIGSSSKKDCRMRSSRRRKVVTGDHQPENIS